MEKPLNTASHIDRSGILVQKLLGYFEERFLKLLPEFPHLTAWGGVENNQEDPSRIPKISPKQRIDLDMEPISLFTGDISIEEAQRLGFQGTFDPVEALEKVKTGTSAERRQKLTEWKGEYQSLLETIAALPDQVEKIVKDLPIDNWVEGLVRAVKTTLHQKWGTVHPRIGSIIWKQLIKYCEKRQEAYSLYRQYQHNPKNLIIKNLIIKDYIDLEATKIHGKVTMRWDDPMIVIKIYNPKDFGYVLNGVRSPSLTLGFVSGYMNNPSIMYINHTIVTIESILTKSTTLAHEGQHIKNRFIITDIGHKRRDSFIRIKDEIIAFLSTDNYTPDHLKNNLHKNYNYYTTDKNLSDDQKDQIAPLFREEVNRAVDIAIRFREAGIPDYLTLLAITPVRQWSQLEDVFFGKAKKWTKKEQIHEIMKKSLLDPKGFILGLLSDIQHNHGTPKKLPG